MNWEKDNPLINCDTCKFTASQLRHIHQFHLQAIEKLIADIEVTKEVRGSLTIVDKEQTIQIQRRLKDQWL